MTKKPISAPNQQIPNTQRPLRRTNQPLGAGGINKSGNFFTNLTVPQKIGLLTAILLIPSGISLFRLIESQVNEVTANNRALEGFQVTQELHKLENLMSENNLAQVQLGINPEISTEVLEKYSAEISGQTKRIVDLANSLKMTQTAKNAGDLGRDWDSINQDIVAAGAITPDLFDPISTILNTDLSQVYRTITKESDIVGALSSTDLIQPGYELSQFNHVVAPQNRHLADQINDTILRAYSTYRNPDGTLKAEDIVLLENQYLRQKEAHTTMMNQLQVALDEQNDSPELRRALTMLREVGERSFSFAEGNIVGKRRITYPLEEYVAVIPELTRMYNSVFDIALKEQENYHKERARRFRDRAILIFVLALLLVGGTLLLASLIGRSIIRPVLDLTEGAKRLAKGEYNTRIPVRATDELGLLARTLNETATQLSESERLQKERFKEAALLQENIGSFLDVTMEIADGDLTQRGKVTEDVLGNVVDSINLMTAELSEVLKETQQASRSVLHGSRSLLMTTDQIENGTALTANGTQQIAAQLKGLLEQIRDMAEKANESADTARQALLVSQHGQAAVSSTLNGMQNIRREVQDIAKRIKSLGDRSLEIQEIVDTISKIAQQTDLLALNASIEAEGAGEAGGRFSIVADEVRKLADTSSQATTRIATLIKTVQAEVQDVIESVEEGTREVEIGYQVAGTAGERLREIGQLTEQSAMLAENIAASTREQVQNVEQVEVTIQEISEIAKQSQDSVQEGKNSAAQLEKLAQSLGQSLTKFKLPSD